MQIISGSNPGPLDHHGCPFRHFSAEKLRSRLQSFLPNRDAEAKKALDDITALVASGHFQVACTRYFEMAIGKERFDTVEHPNEFFEQAYRFTHEETADLRKGEAKDSAIGARWRTAGRAR